MPLLSNYKRLVACPAIMICQLKLTKVLKNVSRNTKYQGASSKLPSFLRDFVYANMTALLLEISNFFHHQLYSKEKILISSLISDRPCCCYWLDFKAWDHLNNLNGHYYKGRIQLTVPKLFRK